MDQRFQLEIFAEYGEVLVVFLLVCCQFDRGRVEGFGGVCGKEQIALFEHFSDAGDALVKVMVMLAGLMYEVRRDFLPLFIVVLVFYLPSWEGKGASGVQPRCALEKEDLEVEWLLLCGEL